MSPPPCFRAAHSWVNGLRIDRSASPAIEFRGLRQPRVLRLSLFVALLAIAQPSLSAQTYTYDQVGRLITAVYADGSGVRYTYDGSGNITAVAPLTLPSAPVAPAVVASSSTRAELTWSTPSGPVTGFVVQRRSSNSDTWTTLAQLPAGSTGYVDPAVPTGESVLYRVQATGGSGNSAYSEGSLLAVFEGGSTVARLINISTRAHVGTDADVLIAGFFISGTDPHAVVIRAVGPGLLSVDPNFPNVLADPVLEVVDNASARVALNDNWSDGGSASAAALTDAFVAVGAFPFPAGSRDSAVRLELNPGNYTAIVRGAAGATGTALAEVYEEASTGVSRLSNISSRAFVRVGAEVMIAGFVVQGDQPAQVLVRAAGPALAAFNVPGTLPDPQLAVHAGSTLLAENDNWRASADVAAIRSAATTARAFDFPEASNDAALLLTLDPGLYSATVSGVDGTTGVTLIEVYQLD